VAVVRHSGRPPARVAEDVVEQHAGADIAALDHALLERIEKPHGLHEVRSDPLEEESALLERLAHEPEVGLLEIADASVNELRRSARRATGPVPRLHHAHAQAAGDGVEGAARADDPPADDEDVEFLLLEGRDRSRTLLRTELRRAGYRLQCRH